MESCDVDERQLDDVATSLNTRPVRPKFERGMSFSDWTSTWFGGALGRASGDLAGDVGLALGVGAESHQGGDV